MLGHSLGELVAACVGGVISRDEALKLVALRGRLMDEQPPGAMLSVALGAEELEHELGDRLGQELALASDNGPDLCVISGAQQPIEHLQRLLDRRSVATPTTADVARLSFADDGARSGGPACRSRARRSARAGGAGGREPDRRVGGRGAAALRTTGPSS